MLNHMLNGNRAWIYMPQPYINPKPTAAVLWQTRIAQGVIQ